MTYCMSHDMCYDLTTCMTFRQLHRHQCRVDPGRCSHKHERQIIRSSLHLRWESEQQRSVRDASGSLMNMQSMIHVDSTHIKSLRIRGLYSSANFLLQYV